MPSCGQLIDPGQRGGVPRYRLRTHDSTGSVPWFIAANTTTP